MPGPKRTPTAILEQRGSWLVKTRKPTEPALDITAPTPPSWLDPAAQEHWAKIVELLVNARVMADAHASALVLLVNALGRYIAAEKDVTEHGAWFVDPLKGPKVHPAWTVRCKASDTVQKLLVEFGMTPAALSRVHAKPKENKPVDGKVKPKLVG